MADRAEKVEKTPWTFFTKGLAEFRRGRYVQSIAWLREASRHDDDRAECAANLLLAMAYHRVGNVTDAQEALGIGKWMSRHRLPGKGEADLSDLNFQEWIMCQVLMQEAKETFANQPEVLKWAEDIASSSNDPRNREWTRAAFDRGESILKTRLPKASEADLSGNFQDWILAQFTYREAQEVMATPSTTETQ